MPLTRIVKQLDRFRRQAEQRVEKISQALRILEDPPARVMSASARRRISIAQKERWARWQDGKRPGRPRLLHSKVA